MSVLIAATLLGPAAAQAAPEEPQCSPAAKTLGVDTADPNAEATALNLAVADMRRAGKSQSQIDSTLAKSYGLTRVTSVENTAQKDQVQPLTDPNVHLSIPAPSIYYDSCARRYSVVATWNFTSIPALRSDANYCGNCAVGTIDVFALSLSRNVSDPGGYSAVSWGATSVYRPASRNIGHTSNHGMAMEQQDYSCSPSTCGAADYSLYKGQIVMGIDHIGCGPLTAHVKYGHSWATAQLTGISIGYESITLSWSRYDVAWNKAGPASNTVWPC